MAEGKKLSERFAPLLKRYNGDEPLFGNKLRWALETIKKTRNGEDKKLDEPSTRR